MLTFPVSHWGGGALPVPIFIGGAADPGGGLSPFHFVVSAACPVGSLVVVFFESIGGANCSVPVDNRGNTYTQIQNLTNGGLLRQRVFTSILTVALQVGDTITVTKTGTATLRGANVLRPMPSPLDIATGAFTGNSQPATATCPAPAVSLEMIFSWFNDSGVNGVTQVAGGFTTLSNFSPPNQVGVLSYLATRSTSAIPWSMNVHSGSSPWLASFCSFKLLP